MATTDMSAVLDILRSVYRFTQSLEEFADSIVFREGQKPVLLHETDTAGFRSFVRTIFICFDRELQQVPSCSEICTLPELLAFVLNSLKRKNRRNVLAHGYNIQSLAQEKRDADHFKFQGDITQSAAYFYGNDFWKKVAARLGTDIARYLLESCSVFVAVPPSCVFQVCGFPMHDRVSVATASTWFYLRPRCRARKGAHFGKYQGSLSSKSRHRVGKKKSGMDATAQRSKRKREADQTEEDEKTCPGKRRRVRREEPTEQSKQVCSETQQEGHSITAGQTKSLQPVEYGDSKTTHTLTFPTNGVLSWRSGVFPPLPPSHCFIRTLGFLYGRQGMHSFILNRKKKSTAGPKRLQGQDLIRVIFFEGLSYLNGTERKPKKLPRRFFTMLPLFCQLLRQHRRCPYNKILQRLCPLVQEKGDAGQGELTSLLSQHCASHRVYLLVRECLSAVIPCELWGSDHNRVHFFAKVRGFLRGGRTERISVAELLWKMKVNDCGWLKIRQTDRVPPSELSYRTRILGQFLAWVLDGFVVSLVRVCFHVTESMSQKNELRFYRQEVWAKLQDLAFRDHISKGQMEELTPAQVASLPRTTVISRLRFIPKTDGMRPITRVIGADPKTRFYKGHTRDLLDVLGACVRSNPSLLGSTVWGMTDIHKVLQSLAPAQKDMPQRLFFVKVDVSGAYESLPHDILTEVVSEALSPVLDELFTTRRYVKIWADPYEGLKKAFVRHAAFQEENLGSPNMKAFLTSLQKRGKVHHGILVEQHFSSDLQGSDVFQFFRQMLNGGVVQFGKKTYRQCRGIPQGSVVSSLLCCLCYAHMENVLFKDATRKGCLMRLVDDFLLITPDLEEAQHFLKTLLAGVPQYGLVLNPQKVVLNFPVSGRLSSFPGICVLPPLCLFPWCGLLLDTHSLDIYKDYTRYAGLSLRYSLTLGSVHSPGLQMRRKLMAILRLRCHGLFLDLKINSLEAVFKNLYKLLLLHAYRFHVCAQSLPFGQTVAKNPGYFLQMIRDMADYASHLTRLGNKGSNDQGGLVQRAAVELIFCLSFILMLSRHRPLYKELLPRLHKWKRSLERRLGDLRLARVRQASNPRTPLDFLTIQI